jgi:predicted amidohydrolase YtcJ
VVALGLGIGAHGQPYLRPAGNAGGPPWRTIVESGAVALGGGSDGARISPFNPWSMIYYMVTGINAQNQLVNDGQQITRQQAVKLYSSAQQGWFTGEDDKLGGIATGRFADLVVLNKEFFNQQLVPDSEIRNMQSSLTIVGGRIVYTDGTLTIP